MGTVELDLEGLLTRLHQREHHSVPFEVEPVNRQGDLAALLTRVNGRPMARTSGRCSVILPTPQRFTGCRRSPRSPSWR